MRKQFTVFKIAYNKDSGLYNDKTFVKTFNDRRDAYKFIKRKNKSKQGNLSLLAADGSDRYRYVFSDSERKGKF